MRQRKIPVYERFYDRIPYDVTPEEADRLVGQGRAVWIQSHRAIRLTCVAEVDPLGRYIPCSTHTATRNPLRAAGGLSQCYTLANTKRLVTGFKYIAARDSHYFEVLCHND